MFGEKLITQDDLTIRIRIDKSIEISHINKNGYRNSKVYYQYPLAEAVANYKKNEVKQGDLAWHVKILY